MPTTYTLRIPCGTDPDEALRLALRAAQQLGLPVEGTDSAGAVVLRVTRTDAGLWASAWLGPAPADDEPEPRPGDVLRALRVARPGDWRRRVRAALEGAGEIPRAASVLGVSERTLTRWLAEEPALRAGLELPRPRGLSAKPAENKAPRKKRGQATIGARQAPRSALHCRRDGAMEPQRRETMSQHFTTRDDAASAIAERLGLDYAAVRDALSTPAIRRLGPDAEPLRLGIEVGTATLQGGDFDVEVVSGLAEGRARLAELRAEGYLTAEDAEPGQLYASLVELEDGDGPLCPCRTLA